MRILLISDHADPLAEIGAKEAGGQNIYVFYLAKFLCPLGINVDIYTRWDRKNKQEVVALNNNLRIIRVKAGPKRYMPRDNFLQVVDEFAQNVIRRIKKEGLHYDIIHTNYWFSGIIGLQIAKRIKAPVVAVYHSIGKIRLDTLKRFKVQKSDYDFFQKRMIAEKNIARQASGIIAASPIEKGIIKKLFNISPRKINVIPIGVDTKIFKPAPMAKARKKLKLPVNEKMLLYVGRIEWRKGIGTLLYALREIIANVSDCKLYVVGGGKSKSARKLDEAERGRLGKIAEELGIQDKVIFLGAKKQKTLYYYYSAADVCIVPSYYEPFGIVPLEAMACGTPVVASRTGGLQFTVREGLTGELAEPRNYNDLANKICLVLKNGKNFYKLNCIQRIKDQFKWPEIAQKYKEYFYHLLSQK